MAERARAKSKTAKGGKTKPPKGAQGSRGKVAKTGAAGIGHNSGQPSPALTKTTHEELSKIEVRRDAAKAKYDQIKGEFRSRYAVAKQDGFDIEALKLARRLHAEDHGIVIQTHANVGTYLAAIGSELATQLDFLQELSKAPPHNATLAGAHAFRSGNDRATNPYPAGSAEYVDFDNSWMQSAKDQGLTDVEGEAAN